MLLAIDVGNTNTVLGVFEDKALIRSWRVKTDPRDTSDELWVRYSALVEGFEITALSICSTVPSMLILKLGTASLRPVQIRDY